MNRLTRRLSVPLMMLLVACSPVADSSTEVVKAAAKRAPKGPRLEGEIHVARQRKRVQPFVLHQPSLDLRVQCLSHRDKLAEEGKTAPLCFVEAERAVETTVTTLRVEHREGMRLTKALARLAGQHEGVHFIVDDGGVPYQMLDLALTARRDGRYPADELRVLSGSAAGEAKLVTALKGLYPTLTLTRVALPEPTPRAPLKVAPQPTQD